MSLKKGNVEAKKRSERGEEFSPRNALLRISVGKGDRLNAEIVPDFKHWLKCLPWYGADYDWQKFDIEQINPELAKYLRWSRDRRMPWGIPF